MPCAFLSRTSPTHSTPIMYIMSFLLERASLATRRRTWASCLITTPQRPPTLNHPPREPQAACTLSRSAPAGPLLIFP